MKQLMKEKIDRKERGVVHNIVAYVLDYNIIVSEFELQFRYYVHFRIIPLGKA